MAALTERRKGSRGRTQLESGIKWAKSMFGQMVKDKSAVFVAPDKLVWGEDSILPWRSYYSLRSNCGKEE